MQKVVKFFSKYFLYITFAVFIALAFLDLPDYPFYVIERGLQNSMMALSLVVLLGFGGMQSLGQVGFLAWGGYLYGVLVKFAGLNPWIAFIIVPFLVTGVGALLSIPSFRLSGPFLVVTTIAFSEITRVLILNLINITGGPFGFNLDNTWKLFPRTTPDNPMFYGTNHVQARYLCTVVVLFLLVVAVRRIKNSRIGLAFRSIKEDEVAAEIIGVNVRKFKLLCFSVSAFICGVSGVIFANLIGYMNPDSLTAAENAKYLLMNVLGGLSSAIGVVYSSLAVTALPEVFRFLANARLAVYAGILLIVIRFFKQFEVLGDRLNGRTVSKKKLSQSASEEK